MKTFTLLQNPGPVIFAMSYLSPIASMHGIFTYIWLLLVVKVKYGKGR